MADEDSVLTRAEPGESALAEADRLGRQAASIGFDWERPRSVLAKVREELDEIEELLIGDAPTSDVVEEEVGDLLFAAVNVARKLAVDPDRALRAANRKFIRRFRHVERHLARSEQNPTEVGLAGLEELWQAAKDEE